MKDLILKKSTRVYLSEKGHNKFFYPTEKFDTLLRDTKAKRLFWVGSSDKIAFTIPESSIFVNSKDDSYIPVWVLKEDI